MGASVEPAVIGRISRLRVIRRRSVNTGRRDAGNWLSLFVGEYRRDELGSAMERRAKPAGSCTLLFMAVARFKDAVPILDVHDASAALLFDVEKLGFEVDFRYAEDFPASIELASILTRLHHNSEARKLLVGLRLQLASIATEDDVVGRLESVFREQIEQG